MLLLPYKLDANLYRVPFVTLVVCAVCVLTFLMQLDSAHKSQARLQAFCAEGLTSMQRTLLERVDDDEESGCAEILVAARRSDDPGDAIDAFAEESTLPVYDDADQDLRFKQAAFRDAYLRFAAAVPEDLTSRLEDRPGSFDLRRMVTSSFAHASWMHLIGNLFFFFAFACCVECVLGPLHFVGCFLAMCFAAGIAYRHGMPPGGALPTIGLSGVCMGMMALLTVLLPRSQVWCLFWVFVWVRRFTLPVILIAALYIGWNVYAVRNDEGTEINYAAHVGGAVAGIVLGILYRLFARSRMDAIAAVADVA